jgi:putative ABC transport system permease protein
MSEDERMIRGTNVLIVDQEFARRHWPNEQAVGKRIKFGTDPKAPALTVVGVVGRVKMESLDDDSNRVQGYFSFAQLPFGGMTIIVKGVGDPNQLIASARQQVRAVDPDQPIYNIRTMDEIRGESVAPQRLNLILLSLFAGIAFVLAIVGIYGVMSYAVTQRTHEIGIRMAIGAQPRDVFRMILGQGMFLTVIGLVIGLLGAFGLTRLMGAMLFAIKPTDPLTFTAVALLLAGVALIACYVPGRRATKVDPVNSLRYE